MRRIKAWIAGGLLLATGLTIGMARLSHALDVDAENEIREDLPSPDGTLHLVVFSRNAGATTGFNTQASLLPAASKLPDAAGNMFIASGTTAKVSWKPDGSILIAPDPNERIFKQETKVGGVAVEYR